MIKHHELSRSSRSDELSIFSSQCFGLRRSCHFHMAMVISNGMKVITVPIDSTGRIVLPKDVRRELAIKAGDRLSVRVQGSAVMLTPDRGRSGFIRKRKALVFATPGQDMLSQEVVDQIMEESRSRDF